MKIYSLLAEKMQKQEKIKGRFGFLFQYLFTRAFGTNWMYLQDRDQIYGVFVRSSKLNVICAPLLQISFTSFFRFALQPRRELR